MSIAAVFFAVAAATGAMDEHCGGQRAEQSVALECMDLAALDDGECLSLLQVSSEVRMNSTIVLPQSTHSLRSVGRAGPGSRQPVSHLQAFSSLAVMGYTLDLFVSRARELYGTMVGGYLTMIGRSRTGNFLVDAPLYVLAILILVVVYFMAGLAGYGLFALIRGGNAATLRPRTKSKKSPMLAWEDTSLSLPLALVGSAASSADSKRCESEVSQSRSLSPELADNKKLLCPELTGAVVPQMCMFRFWMPMIGGPDAVKDGLQRHAVLAVDASDMFSISVLRQSQNPALPSCGPEDYITLSLPGVDRELVVCACGQLKGASPGECSIFRSGQGPFGKIVSNASGELFYLNREDGQGMLTARVSGSDISRTIEITDKDGSSMVTAKWTHQGTGKQYYEVACTPGADVALSIVMVAGVDRILLPVASSSDAI